MPNKAFTNKKFEATGDKPNKAYIFCCQDRMRHLPTLKAQALTLFSLTKPNKDTLSVKTLSAIILVSINFSSVIIFVTLRKIRHFLPTKNFTISRILQASPLFFSWTSGSCFLLQLKIRSPRILLR